MPEIKGTDEGIWRRIHLIPFDVRIKPAAQNKNLVRELVMELPGILNWALKGYLAWRKGGLKPPEAIQAASAEYRREQGPSPALHR